MSFLQVVSNCNACNVAHISFASFSAFGRTGAFSYFELPMTSANFRGGSDSWRSAATAFVEYEQNVKASKNRKTSVLGHLFIAVRQHSWDNVRASTVFTRIPKSKKLGIMVITHKISRINFPGAKILFLVVGAGLHSRISLATTILEYAMFPIDT